MIEVESGVTYPAFDVLVLSDSDYNEVNSSFGRSLVPVSWGDVGAGAGFYIGLRHWITIMASLGLYTVVRLLYRKKTTAEQPDD